MADKNYIDYQLHFDKRVASEFGIPEAVVINSFQKLISYNKSQGKNYHKGRTWTFNSYEEWVEDKYFSCFSKEQMRRTLDSLIKQNVLLKDNFNKMKNDKTNWYAFVEEEKWIERESPITNYGSDRPDGLPESAEQKEADGGLFGLANSAEQKEEVPLPESTDKTAGIDRTIWRNRQSITI